VTQLALLLALGSIGLAMSFVLGRLEVRRGPVAPTVKRIEGAVERAALSLLRGAGLRALALLALVTAALVGSILLLGKPATTLPVAGQVAFIVVAMLGGGLSALVHARLSVALGSRACSVASAATARGSSRSLQPLLRASGATAGFGEGLGLLGLALAFAALYAIRGGFAQAGGAELAGEVVRLLPAFALGAAVTALVLARAGGTLAGATLVGGGSSGERDAVLDATDPRNPTKLAELLAEQVGGWLPRALVSYVAGVSANVAAALLAVAATSEPADGRPSPLTCLLLMLSVRAFGIVASLCGVFAARADENEAPGQALLRGHLCAFAVSAFGLAASLYWLRVDGGFGLLTPGLAGLVVALIVTQVAWLPVRRTSNGARETVDARSLSESAAVARASGAGLACLLPALVLPAAGFWLAEKLGMPANPGMSLVIVTFVAGLIATTPYSLAVAGFGVLSEGAQGAAALARLEGDARRASSRLEEASTMGGGAAAGHTSLAFAASLLLGLFALHDGSRRALPGLELLAICAAIVVVLAFASRATRSALLGARPIADEVKRQLQGLPRKQGAPSLPADFTPGYKACVESALAGAKRGNLPEVGWVALAPFALALMLLGEPSARSALLAFATAAVICGLTFVLASRATRAALREAKRRARATETAGPALSGLQSFGDVLGLGAAASVEALMGVLALSMLSLASLLG
jgi:K(+)-stimulated pyrophosphate-energized sodium pump